jgi:hypothetical protein
MQPLAKILTSLFVALGLLAPGGCTKDDSVGLYDPDESTAPTPTITGISPAGSAFAGMDTIVIQGTNFSPVPGNDLVFFNAQQATLLSVSPSQITLKAPLVTMDSVGVRVSVMGALEFSNTYQYRLNAGARPFGALISTELAASLATDASGNLYAAYCASGRDAGIVRLTPPGSQSTYAPATSGVAIWTGVKMGPAGYLYAARNVRAIYRFTPGGGSAATIWTALPAGAFVLDIDFDRTGNLWCVGSAGNIYRVDANKVITTYAFTGNLRSVRIYNDYLYFAAKTDAGEKIWRAPITAGVLGTPEVYFDFGAAFPGKTPLAITLSSDGVLYIGTDSQDGLVIVSPDKSFSAPYAAYQSLFSTGIGFLAWGSADDLYASAVSGALLKFTIRGKTSAPYFGGTL